MSGRLELDILIDILQNSFDQTTLQTRVLQWDEKLPIPDPPPLRSLVEHLVRRRLPSCATSVQNGLNNLFVHSACRVLGLRDAHKRLHKRHCDDLLNNCWYAPSNHGDTFGIRHDEIYFHENIIPSQPVTSYAVLIRGSPKHPGTSVDGGIGEDISSHAVSMQDCGDIMIERASSLIDGLMKARDLYRSSEYTQDVMKTTALSMQWYNYVFSCSMQFFPGSIERYKAPEINSRHIIVMIRGNMYKLDLIHNDDEGREEIITKSQLEKKLETIVEMDASREPSTPIAFLTSLTPSERCQEEQRLKCLSQRNVDNLSLLRDALFIVALDPDTSPRKANEAMFELHSGNFVNRWYDKSVQLVVFGNGVAGLVNNYLAGMTGTVGTNFVRIAVKNERLSGEETEDGYEGFKIWPEASPIIWDDTNEEYFKHKTAKFIKESRTSGPFKQMSQDVFRICTGFSFESMCKDHCVTPGGPFQAGMQLALAKISGRCMSVNEVVSIRHFRFGGMTFMDSSMADMKKFIEKARQSEGSLQTMTKQERVLLKSLLKKAIESYKDEVLRYKKGQINLWHLDALYRNLGLPNRLPFRNTPQPQIKRRFRQAVADLLRSPLLNILPPQVAENVTSNPCWYPEIEAIGRPGVKCILPDRSMALHYMFGRNAISITVNANPKHPCYRHEEEFVEELEQSLLFVKDLLDAE
ncbi:unnamed protein product [Porites evermanni]|uniref:Choline/carnitine acyltransferase domain-containing protein n=1 Tax=Porites evermanni TaxID=104178 RepID=A0ABN8M2R6_9CNID|nr:unnamed protein product [Porites evermanni]